MFLTRKKNTKTSLYFFICLVIKFQLFSEITFFSLFLVQYLNILSIPFQTFLMFSLLFLSFVQTRVDESLPDGCQVGAPDSILLHSSPQSGDQETVTMHVRTVGQCQDMISDQSLTLCFSDSLQQTSEYYEWSVS